MQITEDWRVKSDRLTIKWPNLRRIESDLRRFVSRVLSRGRSHERISRRGLGRSHHCSHLVRRWI